VDPIYRDNLILLPPWTAETECDLLDVGYMLTGTVVVVEHCRFARSFARSLVRLGLFVRMCLARLVVCRCRHLIEPWLLAVDRNCAKRERRACASGDESRARPLDSRFETDFRVIGDFRVTKRLVACPSIDQVSIRQLFESHVGLISSSTVLLFRADRFRFLRLEYHEKETSKYRDLMAQYADGTQRTMV
jgi:hypothetical protein